MKNPAPYIRQQLYSLLTGIEYNDSTIPVCEEEDGEDVPYQIFLAEQSLTSRDTKNSFNHAFEQVIEVVGEGAKKDVDAIGTTVMDRIRPTVHTKGVIDNSDFQIVNIRKISQNYLTEQTGAGKTIRRLILRFELLITEK